MMLLMQANQVIVDFLNLLSELQITHTKNRRTKTFLLPYDKAIELINDQKDQL